MKSLLRKKPSQSTRQTLLGSSREKAPDASQKARAANGPAKRRLQQDPSMRNSFKGISAFRPNTGISKAALESLESPISRDAYYKPTKEDTSQGGSLRPISVIGGGGQLGKEIHLKELQRLIALEGLKHQQEQEQRKERARAEVEAEAGADATKNVSFGGPRSQEKASTSGRAAGGSRSPSPSPAPADVPSGQAPPSPVEKRRVPAPLAALAEPAPALTGRETSPSFVRRSPSGGRPKYKLLLQGSAANQAKAEQTRNRPQSIFLLKNVNKKQAPEKRMIGAKRAPQRRVAKASPRVSMFISTMQGLENPEEKVRQFEDYFGAASLGGGQEQPSDDEEEAGEEEAWPGEVIDDWYGESIPVKPRRSKSVTALLGYVSYSVDADLIPEKVRSKLQSGGAKVLVRGSEERPASTASPELFGKQRSGSFAELPVPEDDDEETVAEARAEESDVVFETVAHGKEELRVLVGGTVEKLLQNLVDVHFQDIEFINQIIHTHHYFCPSMQVLEYLFQAFKTAACAKSATEKEEKLNVLKQKRILFILAKWMRTCPEDFCANKEARRAIRAFPKNKFVNPDHQKSLQRQIKLMKSNFKHAARARKKQMPQQKAASDPNGQVKNVFQACTADQLAQQLTVAEHYVFAKVPSSELRCKMWSDKDAESVAPFIHRTIQRFNELSYWVASEIVVVSELRDRVRTVKKFIHIMERCIFYRNFNSAMAILSGLNNGSVSRLKRTWKMLPPKYEEMYSKVMQLFSMEKSYKLYRSILVTKSPPLIPYLGVNLKDLTFIEDGNPDFLDEDKRLVNFEKYRMVASVIAELQRYQQATYRIAPDQEIQYYLENMVILSEKQLYAFSNRVENRNTVQNRRQSRISMRITQSIVGAGFGSWK